MAPRSVFYFEIDRAAADRLMKILYVPRRDRRRLGAGLHATFAPKRQAFPVGAPIDVEAWFINDGPDAVAVRFGGAYRGSGRDNNFSFQVSKGGKVLPDVGTSRNFGGPTMFVLIEARAEHHVSVDLRAWAAFDEPGTYDVRGTYAAQLAPDTGGFDKNREHERWDLPITQTFTVEVGP
jgi:hypothetical protein